jgi:WD40 repeat protein
LPFPLGDVKWSYDGELLAVGLEARGVAVYRASNLQQPPFIFPKSDDERITSVSVANNSQWVAAGGDKGTIWLWESGENEPEVLYSSGSPYLTPSKTVALSPDGETLAFGYGGEEQVARIYHLNSEKTEDIRFECNYCYSYEAPAVGFLLDGTLIVGTAFKQAFPNISSTPFRLVQSNSITTFSGNIVGEIIPISDEQELSWSEIMLYTVPVKTLSEHQDGFALTHQLQHPIVTVGSKYVAILPSNCGCETSIILWNYLNANSPLLIFNASSGLSPGIAFSPNGRYLASITSSGELRIWDTE